MVEIPDLTEELTICCNQELRHKLCAEVKPRSLEEQWRLEAAAQASYEWRNYSSSYTLLYVIVFSSSLFWWGNVLRYVWAINKNITLNIYIQYQVLIQIKHSGKF